MLIKHFIHSIKQKSADSKVLREKVEATGNLEEDIDKLKRQKDNFNQDQNSKRKKMSSLDNDCKILKDKKNEKQKLINDLSKKADNYADKIQAQQNTIANRFEKAKEICSKLQMPFTDDPDQSINTQEINGTLNDIHKSISERGNELNCLKVEANEEDSQFQHKIDKLREERTKLETNITTQHSSIKSIKQNMLKNENEIKESEQSIPMLNRINPKIDELEKKLKKLNAESQVESLVEKQDMISVEKMELEEKLIHIDDDIEKLQSASKITGELESKKNELLKDQKDFDRIKNKFASTFKSLLSNQNISSNFRSIVQKRQKELEDEISKSNKKLETIRRENEGMKIQRVNLRKQEQRKDEDIKKIESDADDLCSGREYFSLLKAHSDKVDKLKMELAVLQSSKNTYQDYIHKIEEIPCCPLCHKDLENNEGDSLKGI